MDTLLLNADGQPMSLSPFSVIPAARALHMLYNGKVRVVKEYDDWVIKSQKLEIKVPSIVMMVKHVSWDKKVKYSRGNIYLRDDYTCQLQITKHCKENRGKAKVNELTLDHVVPASMGGKSNWKNICTACKDCNSTKGDNAKIVPKKMPHVPTYYEILAKKKTMPLQIREPEWAYYVDWPEHLIHVVNVPRQRLREPSNKDSD